MEAQELRQACDAEVAAAHADVVTHRLPVKLAHDVEDGHLQARPYDRCQLELQFSTAADAVLML